MEQLIISAHIKRFENFKCGTEYTLVHIHNRMRIPLTQVPY